MKDRIKPRTPRPDLRAPVLRLRHACEGTVAVEFAFIVPLLIAIFACYSELSRARANYEKVTQLARTVADLTSQGDQSETMPLAKMNDILSASKLVLRPFDSSGAKIVVSSVGVYSQSNTLKARICSSFATSNATARPLGYPTDLSVPDGFQTAGMRYVIAEVTMPYTPMLGTMVSQAVGSGAGQFTFKVSMPWPARGGVKKQGTTTEVTLPNGAACPAT